MKHTALILAAAAIFVFAGCSKERLSFSELNGKALDAAEAGNWKDALGYSGRALALEPENSGALVLHSIICEFNFEPEKAIEFADRAISADVKNFFALYTKGRLLFEAKRYDAALVPLRKAYQLRPKNPDVLILLAETSRRVRDTRSTQLYYGQLTSTREFAKSPVPWSELGMHFLIAGRNPNLARRYFVYAYSLAPNDPVTIINMAVLNDSYLNKKRDAAAFYKKYLSVTKNNSQLAEKRTSVEKRLRELGF